MSKSDAASARMGLPSWVAMILTVLLSFPGLSLGVTGLLDWSGIINLDSGVDADIHFLAILFAPFITVFALFALVLFVMGTRGHIVLKWALVLMTVLSLVSTYAIDLNRMF